HRHLSGRDGDDDLVRDRVRLQRNRAGARLRRVGDGERQHEDAYRRRDTRDRAGERDGPRSLQHAGDADAHRHARLHRSRPGERANYVDLAGATTSAYTPFSAVNSKVRVVVTATNTAGSATAASAATARVAATALTTPPVTAGLQLWYDASAENLAEGTFVN